MAFISSDKAIHKFLLTYYYRINKKKIWTTLTNF